MDNRFGLDVQYFEKTVRREMAAIANQTPSDLARVFARLSRASDKNVLLESEFSKPLLDRIQELESLLDKVIASDDDINIDCGEIGIPESLRNQIIEALTEDKE